MGAVLLSKNKVPLVSPVGHVRMAGYKDKLTLLWKKTAGAVDYGAPGLLQQYPNPPWPLPEPYIWNSDGTMRRWRKELRTTQYTPDPAQMRYALLLAATTGATSPPGNGDLPLDTTWTALRWLEIDRYTGEETAGSENTVETEPADPPGSSDFLLTLTAASGGELTSGSTELTGWVRRDGTGSWHMSDLRNDPPTSLWWPDNGIGFYFPASYLDQIELTVETSIHDALVDAAIVYDGAPAIASLAANKEFKYGTAPDVVEGSISNGHVVSTWLYGYGLDCGMSGCLGAGMSSNVQDWARLTGAYYQINARKWYIHEITFDGMNNIVSETKTPQEPFGGYLELNPGPWKNARAVLGEPYDSVTTPAPFPPLPTHVYEASSSMLDAGFLVAPIIQRKTY